MCIAPRNVNVATNTSVKTDVGNVISFLGAL